MGTKIQSKTCFPGSVTDLNNGFRNGEWDPYHNDKSHKISGPGHAQNYDYFLIREAMNGYTGHAKEQIRQTILKQDSIFRHQLQELHRLYKRQKDLMNPVPAETHIFASRFPLADSKDFDHVVSKCGVSGKRVIDLELPADVDESVFNLADLNESIQVEEPASASVGGLSAKKMFFGYKICEKNHNPSFGSLNTPIFQSSNPQSSLVSPWRKISSGQNGTTLPYNHWLSGSTSGLGFLNIMNSKNLASDGPEEFRSIEKHNITDVQNHHETLLPPWLMAKPCEQIEKKKTTLYQMNLDSLQNQSQQFFKNAEMVERNDGREFKKVKKNDDFASITKILGVPITNLQNSKNLVEKKRHQIDLNLSVNEEDELATPTSFPESVIKIATMEIDLEAPAVLESEPDFQETQSDDDFKDTHLEIVNVAAEAIMLISKSDCRTEYDASLPPREPPPATTLLWFAEVIMSKKSSVNVDEMDYFEYMTLKLKDTEEDYCNYKPMILEEKEDEKLPPRKAAARRRRQRKDFQKDVLPSIVSLSRREVVEDLQIFEEAFAGTGVSWQSSLSKRKAAARNGRARRRLVVADTSCHAPPPPAVVEQNVCREVALEEKSLGGWGRRTRRLPRQRCQNSGNHHSLALKC